jgi:hypothetical protein
MTQILLESLVGLGANVEGMAPGMAKSRTPRVDRGSKTANLAEEINVKDKDNSIWAG